MPPSLAPRIAKTIAAFVLGAGPLAWAQAPIVGDAVTSPLEAAQRESPAEPSPALTNAGGYRVGEIYMLKRIPAEDMAVLRTNLAGSRARAPTSTLSATGGIQSAIVDVLRSYNYTMENTAAGQTFRYPVPAGTAVDVVTRFKMPNGEEWDAAPLKGRGRFNPRQDPNHPFAEEAYIGLTSGGMVVMSRTMVFDDQPIWIGDLTVPPGESTDVPLPNGVVMTVTAQVRKMDDRELAVAMRDTYPVFIPRSRYANPDRPYDEIGAAPQPRYVEPFPWYKGAAGGLESIGRIYMPDDLIPGAPPPPQPPPSP